MKNVKMATRDLLDRYKIRKLPVDTIYIAQQRGYQIITYSNASELIRLLNLEQYTKEHKSFCIRRDGIGYILISDEMSPENERWAVAHEMWHIEHHFIEENSVIGGEDQSREQEADLFACYLLAPLHLLSKYRLQTVEDIRKHTGLGRKWAAKTLRELKDSQAAASQISCLWAYSKVKALFTVGIGICVIVAIIFVSIARFPPQALDTAIEQTVSDVEAPIPHWTQSDNPSLVSDTTDPVVPTEPSDMNSSEPSSVISSSSNTPTSRTVVVPSSQPQTQYVSPPPQEPVLVPLIPEILSDGNTYYWSAGGTVYHLSPDCPHLKNAAQITSGELGEAQQNGRKRLCLDCEKKYDTEQKEGTN